MRAAWVYLTQNTLADASYGVDRRGPLERSLASLYQHSNNRYPYPVIIFHEGDFTPLDQQQLCSRFAGLEFREIKFEMPGFLKHETIPAVWGHKFSLGYRHMCRFYSSVIYPRLWHEFDYYARLDDDSFLLSDLPYDIFQRLQDYQLDYLYRVDCQDHISACLGFSETVRGYLAASQIRPGALWEKNVVPAKSATFYPDTYSAVPPPPGKRPPRKYSNAGNHEWNRCGYYNNFHATRLAFWRRPDVQEFLRYLDRTGGNFKFRWNDLITQSAAVQIFGSPNRVLKVTDWDYEHRTNLPDGSLIWGGTYCRDPAKTIHCCNTK